MAKPRALTDEELLRANPRDLTDVELVRLNFLCLDGYVAQQAEAGLRDLLMAFRRRREERWEMVVEGWQRLIASQRRRDAPTPGSICEVCFDAPAHLLQSAPWGGEMGVCLGCVSACEGDQ